MLGFEVCEDGAVNLAVGIVRQAVVDYCNYVENIMLLGDIEMSIKSIIRYYRKTGENLTRQEAEILRQRRIEEYEAKMQAVEKFYKSNWYVELCKLDGDFMIKTTKEKSISRMCDRAIERLKRVDDGTKDSKRSRQSLRWYECLKDFLKSDYLNKLSDHDAQYWLDYIKRESKCEYI